MDLVYLCFFFVVYVVCCVSVERVCVILFSKQIVIVKFAMRMCVWVWVVACFGVSSFIYAKCYRHSFTILSELVWMQVYVMTVASLLLSVQFDCSNCEIFCVGIVDMCECDNSASVLHNSDAVSFICQSNSEQFLTLRLFKRLRSIFLTPAFSVLKRWTLSRIR